MASERKPDLRELTKELRDLTWAEVKAMTIQLGMQGSDLQKIEKSYNDDSERFMNAMNLWLERDTEASWKAVAEALRAIQKNNLAKKIAETFPSLN